MEEHQGKHIGRPVGRLPLRSRSLPNPSITEMRRIRFHNGFSLIMGNMGLAKPNEHYLLLPARNNFPQAYFFPFRAITQRGGSVTGMRMGGWLSGAPGRNEESSLCRRPYLDREWKVLMEQLADRVKKLGLKRFQMAARQIAAGIQWLDPLMESYCALTCPSCEDPCCTGQNVFYNRADILYLIALNAALPPGQTRNTASSPCRYLGPRGCALPRVRRPYVCVWFLCEPQMLLFLKERASFQRKVVGVMQEIRASRLLIEAIYEKGYPDEPGSFLPPNTR